MVSPHISYCLINENQTTKKDVAETESKGITGYEYLTQEKGKKIKAVITYWCYLLSVWFTCDDVRIGSSIFGSLGDWWVRCLELWEIFKGLRALVGVRKTSILPRSLKNLIGEI
ncbi:hypothetical protein CEXT_310571 [Caerostris extrusa]|uniref:Uncharacterized protein n=1 Tax=Caerostris extrusa TaxID=172846 RepID=A0AAV4UZK1_CAEEX|nr:hypothetical protein CEXT_310571 [Caerostris extrusa]